MKSSFIYLFLFLQFFCACNSKGGSANATSENDVDAARNFIRAALDGHYDKAENLVVSDSANLAWVQLLKRNYQEHMNLADKAGYREASINIHAVRTVNDSTSIVNYSNSYRKKSDSLKIIRRNGAWLVDVKYSFPQAPTN